MTSSLAQKATPGSTGGGLTELRSRLLVVFIAIVIYRIGSHIPVPGIDPERLRLLFDQNQGGILDLFNMFSGGALERMSIFALGIIPYISASIITQLLVGRRSRSTKDFTIHALRHAGISNGAGFSLQFRFSITRFSLRRQFRIPLCCSDDARNRHDVPHVVGRTGNRTGYW